MMKLPCGGCGKVHNDYIEIGHNHTAEFMAEWDTYEEKCNLCDHVNISEYGQDDGLSIENWNGENIWDLKRCLRREAYARKKLSNEKETTTPRE